MIGQMAELAASLRPKARESSLPNQEVQWEPIAVKNLKTLIIIIRDPSFNLIVFKKGNLFKNQCLLKIHLNMGHLP